MRTAALGIPIPYAKFDPETSRYYVRCPRCGSRCEAETVDEAEALYRTHYGEHR